jgi:thioredoxin 1
MPMIFAPLIAAGLLVAVGAVLLAQRRSQQRLVGRRAPEAATLRLPDDRPALLYFTGVNCAICHTAQRPAVRSVATDLGDRAVVHEIDVAEAPALARTYRVMTLPTTVVLGAGGVVRAVNPGFAPAARLKDQLLAAVTAQAA